MRLSTNIEGLDQILQGGLLANRAYLVHGAPGTGKTTLGMHFLSGKNQSLLVTFTQPEESIRADAKALGQGMESVSILDLTPMADTFGEAQSYDIFSPSEVERDPIARQIAATIEKVHPDRVFVDGFHVFRELALDAFHYRRLAQSFFRFAAKRECTVLVASDQPDSASIVDGVIQLDCSHEGRWLRITKFRGSGFHAGPHPMRLTNSGMQVLPNAA